MQLCLRRASVLSVTTARGLHYRYASAARSSERLVLESPKLRLHLEAIDEAARLHAVLG
jgi:hypothetical protein